VPRSGRGTPLLHARARRVAEGLGYVAIAERPRPARHHGALSHPAAQEVLTSLEDTGDTILVSAIKRT
jgi:hypothetical protein